MKTREQAMEQFWDRLAQLLNDNRYLVHEDSGAQGGLDDGTSLAEPPQPSLGLARALSAGTEPALDQPVPVRRRLAGRPRPVAEVRAEYERHAVEVKAGYPNGIGELLVPRASDVVRWRLELDCGCIVERLTTANKTSPEDRSDRGRHGDLPAGQYYCCSTEHPRPAAPYRVVRTWGVRRVVQVSGDPEECPNAMSPELWSRVRRPESRAAAFWTVQLGCGHYDEVCTDQHWQPSDGPRLVPKRRLGEIKRDMKDYLASDLRDPKESVERKHLQRMLELGWPTPSPEVRCFDCTVARWVVAFERVGPLERAARPAQKLTKSQRLRRRLEQTEADAARLRSELDELDE